MVGIVLFSLFDQIEALEADRARLERELHDAEQLARTAEILAAVSETDVRRVLIELADELEAVDREALKDLVGALVDQVELDPADFGCRIHYRIPTERGKLLASPRGFEPRFAP